MKEYHIESIIEFSPYQKDLRKYRESWIGCSFAEKKEEINEYIYSHRGAYPSKNMRNIREGVFMAKADTTMEDLQSLATIIKKEYGIDCFQISIEGAKKGQVRVHMLFDWYDRENKKVLKLSTTHIANLSVLILHELNLQVPHELTPTWHRYIIRNRYRENKNCFKELEAVCKVKGLTRQQNTLLRESMAYLELMCKYSLR